MGSVASQHQSGCFDRFLNNRHLTLVQFEEIISHDSVCNRDAMTISTACLKFETTPGEF
jgi:hypothetical protein